MIKHYLAIFCALDICALAVTTANAQSISMAQRENELSVLTRKNPEYDALGSRFAGFILHANLTSSITHKDNLFSTNENKTNDILYKVSPKLELRSDFAKHAASIALSAEKGMYDDNDSENYTNYSAKISLRADISNRARVPLSIGYSKSYSQRSDPDDQGELEPTTSSRLFLSTGLGYRGANIDFLVGARLNKISFEDNATASGAVNNSDRNRDEINLSADLGLSKNKVIAPFIYAKLNNVKYRQQFDDNGLERSSKSFVGGLGLNLNTHSSLLSSTIRIGHINREFDEISFDDVSGLVASANISWQPSTLLALNLLGSRNISETTLDDFSSSVDNSIAFNANYELAPNIFVKPRLSYLVRDFQGDTDKDLKRLSSEISLIYKFTRNLWVSGEYEYIRQSESENHIDLGTFNSNSFNLSTKLQL